MAWTSMHFAVGMGCAGALAGTACLMTRRGWRFIPAAMTLGGVWALAPDLPRIFREDFPSLPLASMLGDKTLERALHRAGDLFFFHHQLDAQPKEYALLGLTLILLMYNLAMAFLMYLEWKQRNSIGNRSWRAHRDHMRSSIRQSEPSQASSKSHRPSRKHRHSRTAHEPEPPPVEVYEDDPVIHRIRPETIDRTG